jgi:hypothetical protein
MFDFAPVTSIKPSDPRVERFLRLLTATFERVPHLIPTPKPEWAHQPLISFAVRAANALTAYEEEDYSKANLWFGGLGRGVASHSSSTTLIAEWNRLWKVSKDPDRTQTALDALGFSPKGKAVPDNGSRQGDAASEEGPWAAANAERDAHLALRAVLYVLTHDETEVGANAQSFATVIGVSVGNGDDKSLLTTLSALTYFLSTVHMGLNPFDDPKYISYSRLLTTHFVNAAEPCMPGRRGLPEHVWKANAAREAANVSPASMAWVEALEIVGSSAASATNPEPVETPTGQPRRSP